MPLVWSPDLKRQSQQGRARFDYQGNFEQNTAILDKKCRLATYTCAS